ncbi:PiggyBac transposable element-derived protein 2, partial [Pseudolycoriella hygida]
RWNLRSALAYYDDQIDENHLTRIFIEPPDEDDQICEESDEELSATVSKSKCEVVLRSGKRLISQKFDKFDNISVSSKRFKKEKYNKIEKKVKDSPSMITKAVKSNKAAIKKCPRRKVVPQQNLKSESSKKINSVILEQDNPPTRSCNEPEKEKKNKAPKKESLTKNNDLVWIEDASRPMIGIFPSANYTDCIGKTAVEQFEKFFDEDLLTLIVRESSKYADYLGKPDPNVTIEELKEISQFLHFKDMSEPNASDKIWKLRPVTDHLKERFLSNFHPDQDLSYDESMIEYYGRHEMKQCLKAKPVSFGYKCWSLCTVSGYLVNFEIYQGKNPRAKPEYEERFGKCIAPLFSMIDDFDDDARCPLKEEKKETIKRGRGYMASKTIQGLDIHLTQWVDNSVVRVASTIFVMEPITPALRYSSVEKAKVEDPRPFVVSKYNKSMGGVDRMDQNMSLYRINIHGKKWWSCIFTWMIDVSIQNAWQLHRIGHPEMPPLDFRREIALYYCGHYGVPPKSTGNRKRKVEPEDYSSLRYDNLRHWPRQTSKRRRCALETSNGKRLTVHGSANGTVERLLLTKTEMANTTKKSCLKEIIGLTEDTPGAMVYSPRKYKGLGLINVSWEAVLQRINIMTCLSKSRNEHLEKTIDFKNEIRTALKKRNIHVGKASKRFLCIRTRINGYGLSTSTWTSAIKINGQIAAVRGVPGRSKDGHQCRYCTESYTFESLSHVLGECSRRELLRNKSNNLVRSAIAEELRKNQRTKKKNVLQQTDPPEESILSQSTKRVKSALYWIPPSVLKAESNKTWNYQKLILQEAVWRQEMELTNVNM